MIVNYLYLAVLLLIVFVLLAIVIYGRFIQGRAHCRSKARLDSRTAVVTGCNTGIGKETVMDFYKRGARVIMACRNLTKASEAKEEIERICEGLPGVGELALVELDLCSLKSVRNCAEKILESEADVSILVNNAGVMTCPEGRTEDGFETHFGSNHLGHVLLTLLLLPRMKRSKEARVVTVSSLAHFALIWPMLDDLNWQKSRYNRILAYALSKTANIAFSRELAKRLKEHNIHNITTYSLHPGVISTELGRHFDGLVPGLTWTFNNICKTFVKTPKEGAQTSIYCALDEKCKHESGLYYSNCAVSRAWSYANRDDYAVQLWEKSLQLVKLGSYNPFTATDQRIKIN